MSLPFQPLTDNILTVPTRRASQIDLGAGICGNLRASGQKYELEIVGGCKENVVFNGRGMCRLRIFLTI